MLAAALGDAYTLDGRVRDAVSLLTQALEQAAAMKQGPSETHCRLSLGKAQLVSGRLEAAQVLAEHALALAYEHQERGYQAHALRLLGEIAMHREPPEADQAGGHYQQALVLAEALGMRPLQANCHLDLGRLYTQVDRLEQARVELSTAIALYRAMEMTFWLPRAEAALASVAESRRLDHGSGS
jgi:tetratricopeptide (TPR) repeat protein